MAKPATAEQPQPEPSAVPDTLFVQDTTCAAGFEQDGKTPLSRTHVQIVDEIETPFTFSHGKKTEMPSGIAMKFLKFKEFIVTDRAGKRVSQTPEQPDEHSRRPFMLRDDQVVADLSELREDSLWKRCQQIVGGEKMDRSIGRGRMVEFLTQSRREEQAKRRGPGDGSLPPGAASIAGAAGDVVGD